MRNFLAPIAAWRNPADAVENLSERQLVIAHLFLRTVALLAAGGLFVAIAVRSPG